MPNHGNVQEIFHAALEIDSSKERKSFLDQCCLDAPELRTKVDRLLQAYGKAGRFLEQAPESPTVAPREFADTDLTQAPHQNKSQEFRIDEQLPCLFGDYELLEKIAHGGMGIVFKARQVSLNRVVAIKMILSGQFAGQDEVKRFYIEAEAAGKLDHSGIVPVFDVGCREGQHYFSMAFIEGESLSAKLKSGVLSPREAATMTKKIAAAMHVAHEQGVVHRDLKPGNVLLDKRGEPRIADFGLAKRVEGDSNLTTTGMVLGTPNYMPPEQAAGKEIDAAADIYSLGAILYASLTGRPPFEGKSQLETIFRVLQEEPTALRRLDRNIPLDLEAICLKCLEKSPEDRYHTAAELFDDLQRYLAGEPIHAKNDIRRRFRKWTLREPVLATHLVASLAMLVIIVVLYWAFPGRGDSADNNFQVLKHNIAILGIWALVVFVLQKAQNIYQTESVIPFAWAAINPIFVTIALSLNDPPLELLLSLYFLLMVTSCFFRRVQMVAITTFVSLLGFSVLAVYFQKFPDQTEYLAFVEKLPAFLNDNPEIEEKLRQQFPTFYTAEVEQEKSGGQPYLVFFGLLMLIIGALLGMLARRLKRLGERDAR